MCLAECRRLAALDVEARHRRAEVMRAPVCGDFHHAVPCMSLAERRLFEALEIERRAHYTGPVNI